MKRKHLHFILSAICLSLIAYIAPAQTVTLNCTGSAGSYRTGSVTAAGVLSDGNMTVSNNAGTPKGWAVFDLASMGIPAGATITAASLRINKISLTTGTTAPACSILAAAGDISVPAAASQGVSVYNSLSGGVMVNNTGWGTNTGNTTLTLNAAALTFLQSNTGNIVSFGLSVNSTNREYTIAGYGGTAATQPKLSITYMLPCAGQPVAGTASGPADVCPLTSFNLSLSGTTFASGLAYQWESSPAGAGTFIPISNATTANYTVTAGINSATDYRAIVTCSSAATSATSGTVTVALSPASQCFCAAGSLTNGCSTGDEYIHNVTFGTINNNSGCEAGMYADYSNSDSTDVVPGQTYTASINGPNFFTGDQYSIWIDFNHNGTLNDPGEQFILPSATISSASIAIPSTALPGRTRMRVRLNYTGAMNPCGSPIYGEVEDYTLHVIGTSCSAAPVAGTAAGPVDLCPSVPFTVSATGYTQALGLSFQWESSAAGTGNWSLLTGATDPFFTVAGGITTATDYRLAVTCTASGATATSTIATVAMSPFYNCYCASGAADDVDEEIYSVTVNGSNSNVFSGQGNGCNNLAPGPGSVLRQYSNFMTLGPLTTVQQGQNVAFSVSENDCDGAPYYDFGTAIWIDYNHDGVFDNLTEKAFVENTATSGPRSVTGVFGIPFTALTGQTGMRITVAESHAGAALTSCLAYGFGETEDYLINITAAPVCGASITAGTASGPSSICAGIPFSVCATGYTFASGLSFQWQSAPVGSGSWTPVPGATDTCYNVPGQSAGTDYRLTVSCSNGGSTAVSNTVSVAQNLPGQCYCTPQYTNAPSGCSDGDNIRTFTLTGENGTAFNDLNTGCAANAYDNRTSLPPVQLGQATSYTGTISSLFGSLERARIWIDFGNDDVFDPSDQVALLTDVPSTATAYSITIPLTAALGNHRMRVRLVYNQTAATIDPCSSYTFGEVHDYTVNITPPPPCLAPTGLTATNITSSSADIGWNNSVTGLSYSIEYGPQGFTPGTGTFIATVNNPETLTGLSGATAYSFYVRSVCSTDSSNQAGPFSFTSLIANDIPEDAIALVVNGGCSGNPYTNADATQDAGEPFASCRGTGGFHSVWYKFIAPSTGFVRITNDYAGGTLGSTRLAIFSASDVTNYSTFDILGCDDNNGSTVAGRSTLYIGGLTQGVTYYVLVDGVNNAATTGSFCLTVDEVNSSMLAAGGSCAAGHAHSGLNTGYQQWLSLVDNNGELIANVRQNSGSSLSPTGYSVSVTTNSGPVRQTPTGDYYLDRNYLITSSGTTSNPSFDLQLFFLGTETAALAAVDPNAVLNNLLVTRKTGSTCSAGFTVTGAASTLLQSDNGSINGVNEIEVTTPGFSNFYIMSGMNPLALRLNSIAAANMGMQNRIDWTTAAEATGDWFEIERSINGIDYTRLDAATGKGKASSYFYLDTSPAAGVNHYRLKMNEASGRFTYSNVVDATVRNSVFQVLAFPNPVTDELTVQICGSIADHAFVRISDITGKEAKKIAVTGGTVKLQINDLSQGVYFVRYSDDSHSRTIKVNKQ